MPRPVKHEDFDDVPDDLPLPPGDWKRGLRLFKKHCAECHSIRPDGRAHPRTTATTSGPTMWNVWNREAGVETTGKFLQYFGPGLNPDLRGACAELGGLRWSAVLEQHFSPVLFDREAKSRRGKESEHLRWTDTNLLRYMKNHREFLQVPNTPMNFVGLKDFQERVDVLHFLRELREGSPFGYGEALLRDVQEGVPPLFSHSHNTEKIVNNETVEIRGCLPSTLDE
uniref:Cytochrome c domain-containing protein n=1 Tax=Chromera velia CCMP2878 TaxID=1169474 RepID=A0A0G4FYK3_9ALVE|eukprot:Cvel_19384.t1-p1 / transcript=Cvel_19384.t1 / gene=Cvel_19384 / organism=Chromera_velia_CCMP2878 / gene_product=hypothetical protein / transcript_product=hypothetical protein / location=Cvel_scaffold1667:2726-5062(+) / protein_length=225 / sequence_SO=supercontig / SO=protein_coding / is_pseudo=false